MECRSKLSRVMMMLSVSWHNSFGQEELIRTSAARLQYERGYAGCVGACGRGGDIGWWCLACLALLSSPSPAALGINRRGHSLIVINVGKTWCNVNLSWMAENSILTSHTTCVLPSSAGKCFLLAWVTNQCLFFSCVENRKLHLKKQQSRNTGSD